MKIKWRVGDIPVGRYRSFEKRGWPYADDENGNPIAMIRHSASYTAALARNAGFDTIAVYIADHSAKPFKWRRLDAAFRNVKDVKDAVKRFLANHPEYAPK